ncbi:E3 ubiquitin-protein ligase ATL4-like [Phoenix dactylifera]|uniref:E3 ubiquitin-protein ligase ATL4-like n=1 Tax=Phoenix dactylifera TaxID=42345 RepID=A0A8B7MVH1_PHODC|nr:E3 ubiquitin-protein ligase ATL4-like [Phoenix dactylifera]
MTFRDMASLPLPPPPPLPLPQLPSPSEDSSHSASPSPSSLSSSSFAYSPSILIIAAILAFVFVASISIYLLLRFLSRSSSSSSAPPLIHRSWSSSTSSASSALSDQEKAALIESLPLFSLASSVAVLPKSSPDCAVCLSPFHPHDELRLLPACRHAFHSPCIDTWLRSTPSCPLCRASITLHAPPLPPPPPLAAAAEDLPRSSSFRIEIGSVSRRRTPTEEDATGAATSLPIPPPLPPPPQPQPHLRSYSLGSSFDYVVDEEVEAVVARIRRAKEFKVEPAGLSPPGAEVAEAAGGGGSNWLKEYVDWLASSASSSFSSLRFSGRWSHRYDDGVGVGVGGRDSWDLEGNYQQREGEESSYQNTFYRWLVGA